MNVVNRVGAFEAFIVINLKYHEAWINYSGTDRFNLNRDTVVYIYGCEAKDPLKLSNLCIDYIVIKVLKTELSQTEICNALMV